MTNPIANTTYTWQFGDGPAGTSGTNVSHTYGASGSYSVTLTSTDACGQNSITQIVTLNLPTSTFSFSGCPVVQFNGPSGSVFTYLWSFGDGTTSTLEDPLHAYGDTGSHTVTLSISVSGCGPASSTMVVPGCNLTACAAQDISIGDGINPNLPIYLSTLLTTIPHTNNNGTITISNLSFNLRGNLVIDVPTIITATHWFCDPGTSITQQANLFIRNNTSFEGCARMWRGIYNFGGFITSITGNSSISDAQHALYVDNGARLNLYNCRFINNIRGIYANGTNVKDIRYSLTTGINNATFSFTGAMKPAYNGQLDYHNFSIAGIEFENVVNLPIRNSFFIDMQYGIKVNRTRISVINNTFTSPFNFSGYGVYVTNMVTDLNRITQGNTFDNMGTSISVGNSTMGTINIEDNIVTHLLRYGIGIDIAQTNGSTIKIINDNNITVNDGIAIEVSSCQPRTVQITDNDITINNKGSALMFESVNSDGRSTINMNRIVFSPGYIGSSIPNYINNCHDLDFISNDITGDPHYFTFQVHGTSTCLFRDNNFINGGVLAFGIEVSPNNTYCCNTMPVGQTLFQGSNEMTNLRNNVMHSLQLTDAVISAQTNAGNIWTGPFNFANISVLSGSMNDPLGLSNGSIFRYNQLQLGGRPASITPNDIVESWFVNNGSSTTCGSSPSCGIPPYPVVPGDGNSGIPPGDTNIIIIIVDPEPTCQQLLATIKWWTANNTTLNPQHTYNIQMILHQWIENYGWQFWSDCLGPLLTIDPLLIPWYEAEKEKDKIRTPSFQQKFLYQAKSQEIALIYDQIAAQPDWDMVIPNPILDNLYATLKTKTDELNVILNGINVSFISKAVTFQTKIAALPLRFSFLTERNFVWTTEQKITISGLSAVSVAEWNQIRSIANMCPIDIGQAVYEARGLLSMIGEHNFPDLTITCSKPKPRLAKGDSISEIKVYPNPSDGRFNILLPSDIEVTTVVIYDTMGKVVKKQSIDLNRTFYLSSQESGIYYYELFDNDKSINRGKLLLIK
ncbi:MAG: PKD domain-containing protein [Saprospiraceae bacterium]|nr:PKD domain-containing protein [Saprospiraceae bacterium]